MSHKLITIFNTNKKDKKGRPVAWAAIVQVSDRWGISAYVQKGHLQANGSWEQFGATQTSKRFQTVDEASNWANNAASERVEKFQKA